MTVLVLDPALPPKTWITKDAKGKILKRSRSTIDDTDEPRLLSALDDPKVERIVLGEEAHMDLLVLFGRPGTKTPKQSRREALYSIERAPSARVEATGLRQP